MKNTSPSHYQIHQHTCISPLILYLLSYTFGTYVDPSIHALHPSQYTWTLLLNFSHYSTDFSVCHNHFCLHVNVLQDHSCKITSTFPKVLLQLFVFSAKCFRRVIYICCLYFSTFLFRITSTQLHWSIVFTTLVKWFILKSPVTAILKQI